MRNRRLLLLSFLLAILLIFLYQISEAFWGIRWFDSVMHFLGGLLIGTFSLWVWFLSGLFGRNTPSKKGAFVAAVIFAMIAGIWWEYFEIAFGIAHPIGSYMLDTFHDMLADFAGAIAAGLLGGRKSFYE